MNLLKGMVGTTSTWFLLDIAFYSQNLFQKDIFTAIGWIPSAEKMNAIHEVYRIARAQTLIARWHTHPWLCSQSTIIQGCMPTWLIISCDGVLKYSSKHLHACTTGLQVVTHKFILYSKNESSRYLKEETCSTDLYHPHIMTGTSSLQQKEVTSLTSSVKSMIMNSDQYHQFASVPRAHALCRYLWNAYMQQLTQDKSPYLYLIILYGLATPLNAKSPYSLCTTMCHE